MIGMRMARVGDRKSLLDWQLWLSLTTISFLSVLGNMSSQIVFPERANTVLLGVFATGEGAKEQLAPGR